MDWEVLEGCADQKVAAKRLALFDPDFVPGASYESVIQGSKKLNIW